MFLHGWIQIQFLEKYIIRFSQYSQRGLGHTNNPYSNVFLKDYSN